MKPEMSAKTTVPVACQTTRFGTLSNSLGTKGAIEAVIGVIIASSPPMCIDATIATANAVDTWNLVGARGQRIKGRKCM